MTDRERKAGDLLSQFCGILRDHMMSSKDTPGDWIETFEKLEHIGIEWENYEGINEHD